eukprot:CAMPEP_0206247672 /NCGR_PEP_ID=MMETSP0047_2-20121206/19943_1 /ASSEMBLY_ACC=CAM_ASM_000192 /TAXON_ID=195065 /ORGANISM="Chroomonas mesostigmatica_cf, Strain CCMP1168" /LENGTH=368 /DNA_ID=CAMNT_0053673229 /DNA_START=31 /DNA_END=1134 /DNA_ORIENTATION=+
MRAALWGALCLVAAIAAADGRPMGLPKGFKDLDQDIAVESLTFKQPSSFEAAGLQEKGMNVSFNLPVNEADEPYWDPAEAWMRVMAFERTHRAAAEDSLEWLIAGQILNVSGLIILIYSEFRMVMLVRGQDMRHRMEREGYMRPTARMNMLGEKERLTSDQRPYLTVSATIFIFIGCLSIMMPVCHLIKYLNLPSGMAFWPCWMVVLFGAIFFTLCFCLFVVALLWSCTRPWAAIVLLVICLFGDFCFPTGNPLLIMLWLGMSATFAYWYFVWYPEWCVDKGVLVPQWCQSLGHLNLSWELKDWGDHLHEAGQDVVRGVTSKVPVETYQHLASLETLLGIEHVVSYDGVRPELGLRVRIRAALGDRGL